jgi:restriction system protein
MAIPDYQTIMLPLLRLASDGREHSSREAMDRLGEHFRLTSAERKELLSSGQQMFDNRVGWATTYMKKAGLLEATRRSHFRITKRGADLLATKPPAIDSKYLERYPEFLEFKARRNVPERPDAPAGLTIASGAVSVDTETPEDAIESAYQRLRNGLASDLLQQILGCSPAFFERLVVDLLVKMGYGGSRRDAGQAIGKSGDGGIDGIIKEDRLGLDVIYIQAKRWQDTVGRPEIQKFVGALQGLRARKGIFITTSIFSNEATQYAGMVENKVVLIDGQQLATFMIDHGVGVSPVASYEIKRVDTDYFTE